MIKKINLSYSKCHWWLILFIAFILPLSQFICTRLIFIALLFSFLVKRKRPQSILFANAWDIALYLLIMTIGLFYSDDFQFGLRVLETNFAFLAFPIILYKADNFDKKKLHQLFHFFSFGLIAASLICLVCATVRYLTLHDVHVFFFYQLTDVLDFQPTYFGYYIIFVISFWLYLFYFDNVQTEYRWGVLLALALLFLALMLTGGLTSFMSILFMLSFFVLKFLVEEKTSARKSGFVMVLVMLAGMFVFSHIYKKVDNRLAKITDYWERITLWESAIKANPDWLLGVGTGDYKKELNRFYVEHQMNDYANENYNSHNQFIQIVFSNGAIGLVAVIFLLARPLYLSVRNQNILGALTFFPFLIYGMTEVFLGRFQGIVFFALLHQAFIAYYKSVRHTVIH